MDIYKQQSRNIWKTWFILTAFLVVVIGIGFVFAEAFQSPIILYVAIAFALVMNITSYWYSDKIILAHYKAQVVTHDTNPALYNTVENLAITAGIPTPKIYIIPDPAPNAFATGRNKEHSAVVVTAGLLQILNQTELEGVIAHELSHVKNRDILLSTIVVVLVGFVSLLAHFFLQASFFGGLGGGRSRGNNNQIFIIIGLVLAILSPIAVTLIQLAVSRHREYLADASGALLTRYPEGLASALEKIGAHAQPMRDANEATAHLFIANPFGKVGRHISNLFSTHPPIAKRIAILRGQEHS